MTHWCSYNFYTGDPNVCMGASRKSSTRTWQLMQCISSCQISGNRQPRWFPPRKKFLDGKISQNITTWCQPTDVQQQPVLENPLQQDKSWAVENVWTFWQWVWRRPVEDFWTFWHWVSRPQQQQTIWPHEQSAGSPGRAQAQLPLRPPVSATTAFSGTWPTLASLNTMLWLRRLINFSWLINSTVRPCFFLPKPLHHCLETQRSPP